MGASSTHLVLFDGVAIPPQRHVSVQQEKQLMCNTALARLVSSGGLQKVRIHQILEHCFENHPNVALMHTESWSRTRGALSTISRPPCMEHATPRNFTSWRLPIASYVHGKNKQTRSEQDSQVRPERRGHHLPA